MTPNHEYCFQLDCPNLANGAELTLPYWYQDAIGQTAQAELTLPFCSVDCLFTFAANQSLIGILEQILNTHWHQRRIDGAQPTKAPAIQLKDTNGDAVVTKFIIPTSWSRGGSQAIVGLPFSSPEVAASFWEQCDRSYYLLLLYLFEHEIKNQADKPIPATIIFVVATATNNRIGRLTVPFDSLEEAHQRWLASDQDASKLILALFLQAQARKTTTE